MDTTKEHIATTATEGPVLVRINLIDCYASSTMVKVEKGKTANDICEDLSTKLNLSETDAMFYSLVCVCKCVDKKSMHWVRTLKANDRVLKVQADMEKKAIGRCKTDEIAETITSSFYYKDIRSNPLDLDGDASGNSSSDDEMEIPLNDLMYFGAGERRGFLQKRSSRDPNVWRRRLCILNDKLWCINVRKSVPWASCVKLNDTTVLEDRPDLKYTNTITLSGSKGQTLFFRTNAALEKHRWREEIRERTLYGAENEVIMMAEMIITDEEEMGELNMQKCFLEVLRTPRVWQFVRRILDLSDAEQSADRGQQQQQQQQQQQDEEEEQEKDKVSEVSQEMRCSGDVTDSPEQSPYQSPCTSPVYAGRVRSQSVQPSTLSSRAEGGDSRWSALPSPRSLHRHAILHSVVKSDTGATGGGGASRRRAQSMRSESEGSSTGGSGRRGRTRSISTFSPALPAPPQDPNLSKKIGRWSYQIFHILHKVAPACAAGVSLICAVQHFKGSFRHDFYIQPKEMWGNALHVYIHYILPYMDFIKAGQPRSEAVSREESLDEEDEPKQRTCVTNRDSTGHEGGQPSSSSSSSLSHSLLPSPHISMDHITHLHRALFSNIRKKRKKAHAPPSPDAHSGSERNASPSVGYSSWFWSTASKPASAARDSNAVASSSGNEIYNTDYEILDSTIVPDINMYDDFVKAVYDTLSEQDA